jgi:hypothetical protein
MFELAERRAQQSMLKTYWTPDTFSFFHSFISFSLSSFLIIRGLPSSHLNLLFSCRDISTNEKYPIVGLKVIFFKKPNFCLPVFLGQV